MSREDVIRRIVQRELQDQGLTEQAVLQTEPDLHQLASQAFGTWETALKYAGVNLHRLYAKQDYTPEQVIQKIRRLCCKGCNPSAVHVRRRHNRLHKAGCQHFGTWSQALLAAGVNLRRARLRPGRRDRLDHQKLLDEVRAWCRAGQSLTWSEVCLENHALAVAAKRFYGGWRNALVAAGIVAESEPADPRRKWNKQRVIACIRRRQQEGMPLLYSGVRKDNAPLVSAARRHFGGWRAAMRAAELSPPCGGNRRPKK